MTNKLRVGFGSDMHLEFGPLKLKNNNYIDVLIFAGDISTPHTWKANHSNGARREAWDQIKFFFKVEDDFPGIPKVYIPGNHEHYKGEYNDTLTILRAALPSENWTIGDNLIVNIKGVTIFAQTLWTNFRNGNVNDMMMARYGMNDFRQITLNGSGFLPEDTVNIHTASLKHMTENWKEGRNLVVSHHLPSYQSVTKGFRTHELNPAYASDLDNWILDHKPVAWIHGHSHIPIDYMIGDTRVISNPRGYIGHEPNVDPDYNYKVIEI